MPPGWQAKGEAVSRLIVRDGEWWRALTALVLHGDTLHLVVNLVSGLLFSAFVLPRFGTGMTWLLIALSGFFGNLANACFYQSTSHNSIGSSTAVFGALGLLVSSDFIARFASPITRSRWQLVLPVGAGLALLAYLGVGEEEQSHTDYMAHLWGLYRRAAARRSSRSLAGSRVGWHCGPALPGSRGPAAHSRSLVVRFDAPALTRIKKKGTHDGCPLKMEL